MELLEEDEDEIKVDDDIDALGDLFTAHNEGVLTLHPVSTDVNSVRNNRPDLIDEIDGSTG